MPLKQIISGGQTGVDRAALDVAIKLSIPHAGFCPKGRIAEDGKIPARYDLSETDSTKTMDRTLKNVLAADGTLIIFWENLDASDDGTAATEKLCLEHKKPCFLLDLNRSDGGENLSAWMRENRIKILNVAGPRASFGNFVYCDAYKFLMNVLE